MDISLLSTTSDPEQLRALAIAMVQKVMAENAELQNRIRILEEQMKLARQQRFGKKCESLAGMQRSLFEEDVDADIAEISAHLDRLLPQTGDEEKTTTRPVRKALPSHLPLVSSAAYLLPNGGGGSRQYNGGYGWCRRSCTGTAGKTVTP